MRFMADIGTNNTYIESFKAEHIMFIKTKPESFIVTFMSDICNNTYYIESFKTEHFFLQIISM